MGQIAFIAAIASFAGAGLLLLLSGLGFWHLRRTDPNAELLPKLAKRTQPSVQV
jgi:cytochrome oxidase assembly protein ShyY1